MVSHGGLDPNNKVTVYEDGTTVDPLGNNTVIEMLVSDDSPLSYEITAEFAYDGPGGSGGSSDVIYSETFSGFFSPPGNVNLVMDVDPHPVIAGNQSTRLDIIGNLDGAMVDKTWYPNVTTATINDHVYVDVFDNMEEPVDLQDTVEFDVNVVNETMANADVTFDIDGGSVSADSPQGINVPYDFSSSRFINVDLAGTEEVCCSAVGVSSTGR